MKLSVDRWLLSLALAGLLAGGPGLARAAAPAGGEYDIEDTSRFDRLPRPRVAVALGGGGARALVNVGVLKALEEERVPVDFVVGSSMGAIVAVLYGGGLSPAQVEELVTTVDLPQLFNVNFPFTRSLLGVKELNAFLEAAAPEKRLEDFPVPAALLSFDLTSGTKYLHTTGRIADAVQGPYAIPLFFPGRRLGTHFLVDGGIHELTPARAARALGADFVIGTTAFDELPYQTYDSPVRTWVRLINLIKEDYSWDAIQDSADVTIVHRVGQYSFMDFQLAQDFVDLGYRETKKLMPELHQALAARGIALREPPARPAFDAARWRQDLDHDRVELRETVVQPQFFVGRDRSLFRQSLFRDPSQDSWLGLAVKRGGTRLRLLAREDDELQAEVKGRAGTAADWLVRAGRTRQGDGQEEAGLRLYAGQQTWEAGLLHQPGAGSATAPLLLHLGQSYGTEWHGGKAQGETDLLLPLAGGMDQGGFVASHQLSLPLGDRWSLDPRLVWANGPASDPPQLYRGAGADSPPTLQGGADFVYHQRFPYSLELLQMVQVTEVQYRLFLDACRAEVDALAVGAGAGAELRLLGLKPSYFGGYLAYDLQKEEPVARLEVNLTF